MTGGGAEEWRPRVAAGVLLRFDDVRACELLLLPERVVRLNPTGGAILRLCDGNRSLAGIVAELEPAFEWVPGAEVAAFLERVRSRGWVE